MHWSPISRAIDDLEAGLDKLACRSKVTFSGMARQTPLTCPGHTRPVVHLHYSDNTPSGFFLISASKGRKEYRTRPPYLAVQMRWVRVRVSKSVCGEGS